MSVQRLGDKALIDSLAIDIQWSIARSRMLLTRAEQLDPDFARGLSDALDALTAVQRLIGR